MIKFLTILSLFFCQIFAQDNPCPNIFKYFNDGYRNYGIITVSSLQEGKNVLSVSIGSNGQVLNSDRFIRLSKSRDEVAKESLMGLDTEYTILLPEGDDIPVIKLITFNGQSICRGPNVFYQNNWLFKDTFLLGKYSLRSEYTSNIEETYPLFSDWLYSQPKQINFWADVSETIQPTLTTEDLDINTSQSILTTEEINTHTTQPISTTKEIDINTIQPMLTTEEIDTEPSPLINIGQRIADSAFWLRDLPFKCGIRPPAMENNFQLAPLILNGTAVLEKEFPWLVYLEYDDGATICGGSLISDRVVITAAHCVLDKTVRSIQLGKHNRLFVEKGSIKRTPNEILIHPEYKKNEAHADVALITFDPVPISDQIFPVCIWPFGLRLDEAFPLGTVAGWGVFENDGGSSLTPLKTALPVVSLEMCRMSKHFTMLATDRTICAGGDYSGPCFGDSGSGFYFRHRKTWYLRGIVSVALRDQFTNQCQTDHYTVFVDLAFYLNWIMPYLVDDNSNQVDIRPRINLNDGTFNKAVIQIDA